MQPHVSSQNKIVEVKTNQEDVTKETNGICSHQTEHFYELKTLYFVFGTQPI
jgi:hypothetical protein